MIAFKLPKPDNKKAVDQKVNNLEKKVNEKIGNLESSVDKKIEKVKEKIVNSQEKISDLDKKIIAVQKSTRTLFKFFEKPHNWLRTKSKIYYNWHLQPYADTTHWILLAVAFVVAILLVGYQLGFFGAKKPSSHAAPGTPKMVNYQGKLTDLNNFPVDDGAYNMNIRIFDAESGGNCLWAWKGTCGSPTSVSVSVTNGIFSVLLGDTSFSSTNSLNLDFNTDTYYLSVQVGTDPEMVPRKRIGAVGYAYNSDTVDGKHETDFALLNGRTGGQTLEGGNGANDDLTLEGTSSGTKTSSYVNVQPSGGNVGIGTVAPGSTLTVHSSNTGVVLSVRNTLDNANTFTVSDSGTINTAGNLVFTANNPSISATSPNTNLSIDANGSGTINVGSTSTGNILLAGGSGATGCTIDNSTGSLTCSSAFSGTSISLSSMLQGSVVFVGASGQLSQNNSNFYWDNSNKRMAIGKNTSLTRNLEVASSDAADTQVSIINTNASDYNAQLGFQLVDGTNNYTVGVQDNDSDKFKICTTALGVNCAFIMDSSGNVDFGVDGQIINVHGTLTNAAAPGVFTNLGIKNNATNPNYQVDITATSVTLWDWVLSRTREYRNPSVTVSLHASGANGLDTGAEAASTWYYLWVIGKNDGTVAGLLSLSSTSPTMPSGYVYRLRVGSVYNGAGSNIIAFNYSDNWFQWRTTVQVLNAGANLAPTAVSLSTAVPPVSNVVMIMAGVYGTNNTWSDGYLNASNLTNANNSQIWGRGNNNYQWNGQGQLILETIQTVYYYIQTVPPANPGRINVYVVGYQDAPKAL